MQYININNIIISFFVIVIVLGSFNLSCNNYIFLFFDNMVQIGFDHDDHDDNL